MAEEFNFDRLMRSLVGAISPTIIVYNEGWSLPEWLKEKIQMRRFEENVRLARGEKIEEASDEEALAYLYTASLCTPFNETFYRIYVYLFYEVYGEEEGKALGVPKPNLDDYELKQLKKLKRWIYEQRERREKKRFNGKRQRSTL